MKNSIILCTAFFVFSSNLAFARSISQQQSDLIQTRLIAEKILRDRTHIMLKDQTGYVKGSISGSLDGNFSANSRLSSALGGGVLGFLAGAGLAMIAPLAGPMALSSIMSGGVGAAVGGGAGALMPEQVANGKITGSISGTMEGKNWTNLYGSQFFSIVVIDPSQQLKITELKQQNYAASPCVAQYDLILSELMKTRRYLTPAEATDLLNKVSQIRVLNDDLEVASSKITGSQGDSIRKLVFDTRQWLNKKMTIISVGSQGLKLIPLNENRIDSDIIVEKRAVSCGAFALCSSDTLSSSKLASIYMDKTSEAKQIFSAISSQILTTYRLLDEKPQAATRLKKYFVEYRTSADHLTDTQYCDVQIQKGYIKCERGGSPKSLYITIKPERKQVLGLRGKDQLCRSKEDLVKFLEESSVSEDLLFDTITPNTTDQFFRTQ